MGEKEQITKRSHQVPDFIGFAILALLGEPNSCPGSHFRIGGGIDSNIRAKSERTNPLTCPGKLTNKPTREAKPSEWSLSVAKGPRRQHEPRKMDEQTHCEPQKIERSKPQKRARRMNEQTHWMAPDQTMNIDELSHCRGTNESHGGQ